MPSTSSNHPAAGEIAAYALGQMSGPAAETIRRHVESCSECLTRVEKASGRQAADVSSSRSQSTLPPRNPLPSQRALTTRSDRPASGANGLDSPTKLPDGETIDLPVAGVPPELRGHARYRIIRRLGQGGMGVVFQAEHRLMERIVAIKVVSPSLVSDADAVERFKREVRAAARLDHANIVKAFDAEQAGDLHFLAMEYVEGWTLAAVLAKKGPLPVANACHYIRQAALGLQHAHEKEMIHRDLKPQNLMLTARGGVKILDFGLAKLASERQKTGGLTQDNVAMGTPEYMAPEQARDTRNADIRADIYALGGTLFTLLAGRPPFPGHDALAVIVAHLEQPPPALDTLRPEVPGALASLVARMLAKSPADRPQTPREVADALLPFAKAPANSPTPVPRTAASPTPRPAATIQPHAKPPRWRSRGAIIAGLCALAVGLGLAIDRVIRVKTADGIIVLTVNEPDAEVLIDGDRITVAPGRADAVQIARVPGKHTLEIRKGGFKAESRELTLDPGGRHEVSVRLDPLPAVAAAVLPKPPPGQDDGPRPPEPNRNAAPPLPPVVVPPPPVVAARPLNRWISLDPREGDLISFSDWKHREPDLAGDVLRLRNQNIAFHKHTGRDVVLRAQVRLEKPVGNGGGSIYPGAKFSVRSGSHGQYLASFNRWANQNGRQFIRYGLGKGVGQHAQYRYFDIPNSSGNIPAPDGFFEVSFSAIGDRLALTIAGRTVFDIQDSTHSDGRVDFNTSGCAAELKDMEFKVLRE